MTSLVPPWFPYLIWFYCGFEERETRTSSVAAKRVASSCSSIRVSSRSRRRCPKVTLTLRCTRQKGYQKTWRRHRGNNNNNNNSYSAKVLISQGSATRRTTWEQNKGSSRGKTGKEEANKLPASRDRSVTLNQAEKIAQYFNEALKRQ